MSSKEFTNHLLRATNKFAYQYISECVKFFNLSVNNSIVFQIGTYKMTIRNRFISKFQGGHN